MQNFMIMEPSNLSFQELMANGSRYKVPRFQRDYAWQLEQWEDLWADIESLPEEYYHYMGYIVLQRKAQHEFDVIDGQQRLVTLSILVLAVLARLKEMVEKNENSDNNKERIEVLTSRFIGAKNSITLQVESKLTLNRNNGAFFKYICTHLNSPTRRSITTTNRLLQNCFKFFHTKFKHFKGDELAAKVEQIANGMMFTRIVVQDDLNAYKVFETLNARGVQLSTPDLIKNYIFSVITQNNDIPDANLDELDAQWSEIVQQLGEANFTEFVRYHHNIQTELTTKKNLFKSIRNLISTPAQAHEYLNSLSEYGAVYSALLAPHDEFWHKEEQPELRDIKHYLEGFQIFNIKQPFSILMAAYFKINASELVKLARYLFILSIRYNVIGNQSTNTQELVNNKIAINIYKGEYTRASHVKNSAEFKKLYPDDEYFKARFELHRMPTRQSSKKVRFLLTDIERYLGNKITYTDVQLEHICPYNPDGDWHNYFGEGIHDIQDRLGNVVLLHTDDLKRSPFEIKRKSYAESGFKLAKKVAAYPEWDLATLNAYQAWLAEQAIKTWQVNM